MRKLVFPTVRRYSLDSGPSPIAGPVDGVSAGRAGAGYGSRLNWQYRGLL